ncbi:MAG: PSD1 and planctomycete cytochrome C domain-containing protein [Gemmataceae bacterium]
MRNLLLPAAFAFLSQPVIAAPVDFNRDIRPILASQCYACHGPDEKTRKADLRLDVRDSAVKSGALVPGKIAESKLLERIMSKDADEVMPPPKSKKPPLTAEQIALFKQWISEGANYSEHWSFAKLTRPEVPKFEGARNPIDAFIRYRLQQEGVKPSSEADRVTLIRRLNFDLTGLPPKPEEIKAFVEDKSADAYEKVVDRLLASPHYGERMAVWWLDLVRFADSAGYHSDNEINVTPYRDWVINAFNTNQPFDRFTVEQIAGDLLPSPTLPQRVATAYNRLLQTTEEGGAQAEEYIAKYSSDRVRNYGQVWLGGTIMCAECHNHKFDPYTQKDFYSIAAFFADVQEAPIGRREPGVPVPSAEQEAKLAELTAAIAAKQSVWTRAAATRAKLAFQATFPKSLVTTSGPPRVVRVLSRGNWQDKTGEIMKPNTPGFLPPLQPKKGAYTRLDLANWTVAPENPLTARVAVNRLWKLFYGYGIARSLEESGAQGQLPTHPELLDWLASEFKTGWDVKKMVRLMVTSQTYRQSSIETPATRERDPFNKLFARQSRWRLDAEFIRDNALAISGLLSPKIGGESVKPYQPAGYWSALNFPTREWQKDTGEKTYRRGMYTHWQRSFPHPAMIAFDATSREECTCERPRSNIPQQALVLLNDPEFVEASKAFAIRVLTDGGKDDAARVAWAFAMATGRSPKEAETKILLALLAKHRKDFAAGSADVVKLLGVGELKVPKEFLTDETAAWVNVCRAIINLHETMTRH